MKINQTIVKKMEISEVPGLDPVRVYLEQTDVNAGRITFECFGMARSTFFGGIPSGSDLERFVANCGEHYLANRFMTDGEESDEIDLEDLKIKVKKEIIKRRRRHLSNEFDARNDYSAVDDIDESIASEYYMGSDGFNLITDYLGESWRSQIKSKRTPRYQYVLNITRSIQKAIKEIHGGDVTC